ncbi:MAG: pyridoxal phosphate-dependent aminotransferase [Desulfobacteraceae bacterium]|nr:MAG: pyridoxal phosphate-dependent aminotransferase [Desulfobacteraceae bacterium]
MIERSVYKTVGQREDTRSIARRVAQISVSAIKQMPVLASRVDGCISLGQGIPSFATPSFIREAVIDALRTDEAIGKYSLQPGMPRLKNAISNRLREKGIRTDPETEIFVSCGAMEAIAAALSTIVERDDEVLLPSPNYSSHIEQILFAEGMPVFVPLIEKEGWRLDIDGFKKRLTSKTRAIVLCNPMNPTGAVFSREELLSLAEIAVSRDLFIIADEAYDFLIYDDLPYFSLASIPELRDRLIACFSFSKIYCMTGWRIGYMVASSRVIDQVLKVHDAFAICAPTISQYAALAALNATNGRDGEGDLFIKNLVKELSARREVACTRLDMLSHLFHYEKPKGAYYVFPRIVPEGIGDMDLALKLLYEARVITIPGSGFGPTGDGHIRISFGAAQEDLNKAFDRIEEWAQIYE